MGFEGQADQRSERTADQGACEGQAVVKRRLSRKRDANQLSRLLLLAGLTIGEWDPLTFVRAQGFRVALANTEPIALV